MTTSAQLKGISPLADYRLAPQAAAELARWGHDLERYYLGMVTDDTELAALEEHILACGSCAERADLAQDFVDAMRSAALDFSDPRGERR